MSTNALAELELAPLDEQHDARRRRHRLGDRRHVEHGVGRHRQLARLKLLVAVSLQHHDLAAAADADDAAGHAFFGESLGDDLVDAAQVLASMPAASGSAWGKPANCRLAAKQG